jgi:hypothetical protein
LVFLQTQKVWFDKWQGGSLIDTPQYFITAQENHIDYLVELKFREASYKNVGNKLYEEDFLT